VVLLYSSLREARQREIRTVAVGRGTAGRENPFRSDMLNEETLEMYRDLVNRPLPRLPKLYTLPSRY